MFFQIDFDAYAGFVNGDTSNDGCKPIRVDNKSPILEQSSRGREGERKRARVSAVYSNFIYPFKSE